MADRARLPGRRAVALAAAVAAAIAVLAPTAAHPAAKRTWPQEKCARYQRDWAEALRRWGTAGVSGAFIDANEAFIRAGCVGEAKVCPSGPRERELADALAIRVANEGMSTTFLPFGCRD